VVPTSPVTATFTEPVQAATVTAGFTLKDAGGNLVAAAVAYNDSTHTATLTPNAALAFGATYTATLSGVKDVAGNPIAAAVNWSFTTVAPVVNATLFGTAVPAVPADSTSDPVELGVKFRSDVSGYVTAIRFYKGAGNTGTHIGHLWTGTGTLLGAVTFTDESATGWQRAELATPVAVAANTTYVVSYFAPNGHQAYSAGYFNTAATDSGVLHAPTTAAAGGNGVYMYSSAGGFPTNTYNGNNYWADAVFSSADNVPPSVTGTTPANGATGVIVSASLTATFTEPIQIASISFTLTDPSGTTVPATFSYDPVGLVGRLTPNAPLAAQTTYTAKVSGVKDLSGNLMNPVSWTFTTAGAWLQTTATDFGAGTLSGTIVTNSSGGEVQLAPSFSDDFTGAGLSPSWTTTSWASSGGGPFTISVSGSVLALAGGAVYSTSAAAGNPVEARLNFAPALYQHFGLVSDFNSNSWALFSTMGTTNTLFARVNAAGAAQDVSLGGLPAGFHTYLIKPVAGAYQFYVDGNLATTITATIPNASTLHIGLSSYTGSALQADWVRIDSYPATGTYTSTALDTGGTVTWSNVNWTAAVSAGATMDIEVSSSVDGVNWSSWTQVANGGPITAPAGRYLRYRFTFTTSDPSLTASLADIIFVWS
jgi:hypothetical protein